MLQASTASRRPSLEEAEMAADTFKLALTNDVPGGDGSSL